LVQAVGDEYLDKRTEGGVALPEGKFIVRREA